MIQHSDSQGPRLVCHVEPLSERPNPQQDQRPELMTKQYDGLIDMTSNTVIVHSLYTKHAAVAAACLEIQQGQELLNSQRVIALDPCP